MGTTADKLAYLEGTKTAIREAISARGVDVPESTAFRAYAGKIAEISGGGTEDPLDPEFYYTNCRPKDWLTMPEPQDNEIYFLLHIPQAVKSFMAFTVECSGNYTVEYGTVESGAFTPDASVSLASGATYEAELDAEICHSTTSEGKGQLMFRVSGQGISAWRNSKHSRSLEHANWNVVDFVCRLPSCAEVKVGDYEQKLGLSSLRFFAWFGGNALQDMSDMFSSCNSLQAVRALDTSSVTNMYGAFYDCCSLVALPTLDTGKVTNMADTFGGCYSLTLLPELDTSAVASFRYTFSNCRSLRDVSWIQTVSGTDFENCFYNCCSLRELPPLSLAGAPGEYGFLATFDRCFSLEKLIFTDVTSGWPGGLIDLTDSLIGHDALIAFFDCLPSVSTERKVMLYNVPGTEGLTEAETSALAAKGWTLVY